MNDSSASQLSRQVSEIFDPVQWRTVEGFEDLTDITYHRGVQRGPDGALERDLPWVRVAFDRPEVRNAFRPGTVDELYRVLDHARMSSDVGAVILTGNGPSAKDGGWAFCSGGDQRIRGRDGYRYAEGETAESVDPARAGRLHILEVQRLIRTMPKPVIAAVEGLDATEEVDVIVIARGGGAVEDLLPFSNETMIRAVSQALTPVVSAIGHDIDTPLLDFVADIRASTPTDAAKRVVPDIQAELEQLDLGRTRLRAAIRARIEREQSGLDAMRSRPVLENPSSILAGRADEIRSRISLARTLIGSRLDRAADEVSHLGRQVRALSPLATLERGYAVVQTADGTIIRAPEQSEVGEALSVRVAGGRFGALHVDTDPYTPPAPQAPTDDRARPGQDRTENDEETA